MLLSLLLFAQQQVVPVVVEPKPSDFSPEWWIKQFTQLGFFGCLAVLALVFIYRYGSRALDAHINFMDANAKAAASNEASLRKLTELNDKQQTQLDNSVKAQAAAAAAAESLMRLHSNSNTTGEARLSRALDLIDLVVANIAPDIKEEARKHTDALRFMTHQR